MELVQIAQHADDLVRATRFYERLLGEPATATFDPPGLVFFRLGSTRLLIEKGAPSALVYVLVDSVRNRVEALRSDGITIESEPHIIFRHEDDQLGPAETNEWHAFIRDSEGNLVGLVSHEA
jgi:methylmalonyl-CoA/ethylmalonyl-CoA epimerase